ncbi:MAG TPA: hypothetical protein VK670_14085, partial [Silvibacterium sp.]|nr:hypothetical protein [Silvibacterium sp.]
RAPAWLAMSVFLGSSIAYYAVDARPYPLLLFFTGLALCCWQVYCVSGNRMALAGIALSVAGAIGSHQYGVIYTLFPLFAGEAARTLRRRKLDLAVWIAGAVGSLTVFLTFPPMLRGQKPLLEAIKACQTFAARPHWTDLKLYAAMLPRFIPVLVIFWLVILILWIALAPKRERSTRPAGIPVEDWAAAIAATLLLPLILIVARLGTNYFQGRYGIGSGLGIAMLCGMLLSQLRWRYAAALGGVAAAYGLIAGLLVLRSAAKLPEVLSWTDPVLRVGSSQELRSGEPIVIANATEFSPLWWYSDEQMRARIHYLTDASYTARQSWLVPEYSLLLERAYLPMRLDDYQTWLAGRRHFLLYCSGDPELEWIKHRLADEGWHLTLLQSAPAVKAPGAKVAGNREMYEVSR